MESGGGGGGSGSGRGGGGWFWDFQKWEGYPKWWGKGGVFEMGWS